MKYISQLDYAHVPYRTQVKNDAVPEELKLRTVRKSGCGLCSVCMMIENMTDKSLSVEECVKISEGCLANHAKGTDMKVLAPVIAEKFDINYTATSDLNEAISHLQKGGMIVGHVGVPEGKEIGLFTKGGHYVLIVSTDGKEFCVLDPSYSVEKFNDPARVGRINVKHAPFLYCDVNVFDSETRAGKVKYHMFSRKSD